MKKIIFRHVRAALHLGLVGALLLLAFMLVGSVGNATAETKHRTDFDHLKTGFPLDGAHARLKCEDCHVQGIFKGTPKQCSLCHSPGSRTASTSKPANHVRTVMPCESCHTSSASWIGARFSHTDVAPGTCTSCHGITAAGKPSIHVTTAAQCDTCHRTSAWIPASFSHANVQPGTCKTCHGVTATGKPNGHIATSDSCDVCHRTTAWIPATFSHPSVQPGSCAICHGVTPGVTAKPGSHIPTTASCDLCHTIAGKFLDGRYHANVQAVPGNCATCHGINPNVTGKSSGHFVTARPSCDACHTTTAWTPVKYAHTTPYYRAHTAGVTCANCHKQNNEVIAWPYSAYRPDCAGCHAGEYKPHDKAGGGTYTVLELKDCTGACHDPAGHHRPTDSSFN